jgi:hypothetical protein
LETPQSELFSAERVTTEEASKKNFSPPSECTPEWFTRFIEVAREHQIDQVTTLFLRSNKITAIKHEYKLMGALKFLGIVDGKGNPTDRLSSLLVIGDAYKQNLRVLVEEAYSDLLKVVSVKTTTPEGLHNYFISKMKLGKSQAEGAAEFFVWLANESGLELSEDLLGLLSRATTETRDHVSSTSRRSAPKSLIQTGISKVRTGSKEGPLQSVQTNINIALDKDTPIETWKLVFRLLGIDETGDEKQT